MYLQPNAQRKNFNPTTNASSNHAPQWRMKYAALRAEINHAPQCIGLMAWNNPMLRPLTGGRFFGTMESNNFPSSYPILLPNGVHHKWTGTIHQQVFYNIFL